MQRKTLHTAVICAEDGNHRSPSGSFLSHGLTVVSIKFYAPKFYFLWVFYQKYFVVWGKLKFFSSQETEYQNKNNFPKEEQKEDRFAKSMNRFQIPLMTSKGVGCVEVL